MRACMCARVFLSLCVCVSTLCLVSVCLRGEMFVLLSLFFLCFCFCFSFFCLEFCEVVAGVYSNENACIFSLSFLLALKRVGFDVWDDGAVWKTVSVRVLKRQAE